MLLTQAEAALLTQAEAAKRFETGTELLTQAEAAKRFETGTDVLTCTPTGKKRLIIPAYGFSGAIPTQRPEYPPPDYQMVMQDVKGLEFYNPKDNAKQVLKQDDGCIICYDAPGLKESVDNYITENPQTFKTAAGITKLIDFLVKRTSDVYDTDIGFAGGLIGAPERIEVGHTFVGAKKKETVMAFEVPKGTVFTGPSGEQTADEGGAVILKDSAGMRLIQKGEFDAAYAVISPATPVAKATGQKSTSSAQTR